MNVEQIYTGFIAHAAYYEESNGALNSYGGATTNLIGDDTNFDSGLINVYNGSALIATSILPIFFL